MQISRIAPFAQHKINKVSFQGEDNSNIGSKFRNKSCRDHFCYGEDENALTDKVGRPRPNPFNKDSIMIEYKRIMKEVGDLSDKCALATDRKEFASQWSRMMNLLNVAAIWANRYEELEKRENAIKDE